MNDQPIDLNNARRTIKEVHDKLRALESQKAEIQASITEAKAPIKALGMKMKDFNIARRLADLEEDERAGSLDNLRMCFEALGVGGQGDLFSAKAANEDAETKPRKGNGAKPPPAMDDDQPRPAA